MAGHLSVAWTSGYALLRTPLGSSPLPVVEVALDAVVEPGERGQELFADPWGEARGQLGGELVERAPRGVPRLHPFGGQLELHGAPALGRRLPGQESLVDQLVDAFGHGRRVAVRQLA